MKVLSNGWIKIHRSILDHWIWQDEKYSRWWITLLLSVNHSDAKFMVGDEIYMCKSGESFRSLDEWARLFGCSKKTVVKFFTTLKKDSMINTKILGNGNRRKHLLSVENWLKYQHVETEKGTKRKPKREPQGNPNLPPNNNEEEILRIRMKRIGEWDFSFLEDDFKIFLDWLEYKKDRKESYKSQRSIQIAYKKMKELSGNNSEIAKKIVEQSMANNYAGLFEFKQNGKNSTNHEPEEFFDNSRFKWH
jgi:hypothetical protein